MTDYLSQFVVAATLLRRLFATPSVGHTPTLAYLECGYTIRDTSQAIRRLVLPICPKR